MSATDILVKREVVNLFKQANEWRPLDMMGEMFDEPETASIQDEVEQLKHNFLVGYVKAHRDVPPQNHIECMVLKVPTDLCDEIHKEIDHQIDRLGECLNENANDNEAALVQHYTARKKKRNYTYKDVDGQTIPSHFIEVLPIEGDEDHFYMAVFMHSELRALTAARLLQQEVRARA